MESGEEIVISRRLAYAATSSRMKFGLINFMFIVFVLAIIIGTLRLL